MVNVFIRTGVSCLLKNIKIQTLHFINLSIYLLENEFNLKFHFSFHTYVEKKKYVAIDFMMVVLCIILIQMKRKFVILIYILKPYINKMGRLWGSSRFMSPEEFELNAMIDARTNVFNMGAMAFTILGGGKDRSFTKWEASRDLYEIAYRAVNENRAERYASVEEFYEEWVNVLNTKRYKSISFKQIYSLYYYHDNIYEKEIKNNEANIMNFVYINQHVLNNLLYILSSIFIFILYMIAGAM